MHKGQQATTAMRGEREPQEGPGFGSNKQLWETSQQNSAKPPNPLLLKSDSHWQLPLTTWHCYAWSSEIYNTVLTCTKLLRFLTVWTVFSSLLPNHLSFCLPIFQPHSTTCRCHTSCALLASGFFFAYAGKSTTDVHPKIRPIPLPSPPRSNPWFPTSHTSQTPQPVTFS